VTEVTEVVDEQGTSLGTAHSKISSLEAAQLTMTEQINAIGDVYTDFPQPPYKAGDVWHMPELTVDYWLNSGLTVDQVMALGITVDDRMGGNSYVCINSRETGSFTRSDWMITGSTDKMSVVYDARFSAQEVALTEEVDKIETELTQIRAGYVRIVDIDGTYPETIIDGGVINTGSVTAAKLSTIAGFTFSNSTMTSGSGDTYLQISGASTHHPFLYGGDDDDSAKFAVSQSGRMYSRDAYVYGEVRAAKGQIGPLKVSNTGLTFTTSGKFQIDPKGNLKAKGVDLDGNLVGSFTTKSGGGIWIDQKNHYTRIKDDQGDWRVFGVEVVWGAEKSGGSTTKKVEVLALKGEGTSPPSPPSPGGGGSGGYQVPY